MHKIRVDDTHINLFIMLFILTWFWILCSLNINPKNEQKTENFHLYITSWIRQILLNILATVL